MEVCLINITKHDLVGSVIHLGKTETILFGSKKKVKRVEDFKVSCNGTAIKETNSVKYLGVTLDNTLSGESMANSNQAVDSIGQKDLDQIGTLNVKDRIQQLKLFHVF